MQDLLITGCSQLLTLRGPAPRRGKHMLDLGILRDGALLIQDGKIAAVGTHKQVSRAASGHRGKLAKIDLEGRVVLPGFVDSHTHLVFAATRADEHEQRIAGATYEQIAKSGGGIVSSVRKLRKASREDLIKRAKHHLKMFAAHGTTTLEAKSGYGLDLSSEMKTLEVLRELRLEQSAGQPLDQPLDIVPTFLGAHVAAPEYRRREKEFADLVARVWMPIVARSGLAKFCDVFCDRGAFSPQQAEQVLTAGLRCGLKPRIHAEQLARTGAALLAVKLKAASADHLEKINARDVRALAASDVASTLLPGCCFHLDLAHRAPARALISAGAIVALATDFNPGTSPTLNMQMILSLASAQLRMSPAEAITAATINGAYALRLHDRIGSLEVGKLADFAVFDVDDYREISYYFGVNRCSFTFKRGKIIYSANGQSPE